ncbi:hypothetical protein PI172_0573 [Prevotella intermedia]|uniref:Uncharacterized protein n=1 Tax=Prevotella intermedia TaxID=28131 RepID=A0AAD1F6V4_PREIN|nr:hypothetical protein PI172_0573 [Prevotella intermedia]
MQRYCKPQIAILQTIEKLQRLSCRELHIGEKLHGLVGRM